MDEDAARRERARQRSDRIVLNRARLGPTEPDPWPVRGLEAIELACELSRAAWLVSGRSLPTYSRAETPYRFVPWPGD